MTTFFTGTVVITSAEGGPLIAHKNAQTVADNKILKKNVTQEKSGYDSHFSSCPRGANVLGNYPKDAEC